MIPIYEQGYGRGIGHSFDSFRDSFEATCRKLVAEGRTKAFAFIFYDFLNHELRKSLRDQGVFAQLDRLSGQDLSIFYLHSGGRSAIRQFNEEFLSRLGFDPNALKLPCVIFFRTDKCGVTDIEVEELRSPDLLHGFHELFEVVKDYKDGIAGPPRGSKWKLWGKRALEGISIELFVEMITKVVERAVRGSMGLSR